MYNPANTKEKQISNLAETLATELKIVKESIPTVADTYSSTSSNAMSGKAVASAISGKADSSALSGYVPTTRTINSKALSGNISLTASDVGAMSDKKGLAGQSGNVITNPWYKFASVNITRDNRDENAVFVVQHTYGTTTQMAGILRAHIRRNATSTTTIVSNTQFEWLQCGIGIDPTKFVLCWKSINDTTKEILVELYCKADVNTYGVWSFNLISETQREKYTDANPWTLYTSVTTGLANLPSDTTQIVSTIQNSRVGDVVRATVGQVSQDIIKIYDDGDTANNYGFEVCIGGNGNMFIGGGESPHALRTVINKPTAEDLHLSADGATYVHTNVNTVANRKTSTFETSGNLLLSASPAANDNTKRVATTEWVRSLHPLMEKTYTGWTESAYTAGTNDKYFMSVKPTSWKALWTVKMKIKAYVPNQLDYYSEHDIIFTGTQNICRNYQILNQIKDTNTRAVYNLIVDWLTEAGCTAGLGHCFGLFLNNISNYNSADYPRTIEVSILEQTNCTCTLFNTLTAPASIPSYSTTNYTASASRSGYDLYNYGLRETGDDNNIYQLRHNNGNYASAAALYRYQLCFQTSVTQLIPANAVNNDIGTSKTLMTSEFDPFGAILYYSSTTNIASGGAIGANTLYEQVAMDLRYSFNTGTSLTAHKAVYLKCSPQANGRVKFASGNPIVQALPTTNDGFVYIYIGQSYSTYQIELAALHPVYCHDGKRIKLWTGDKPISQTISNAAAYSFAPNPNYIYTLSVALTSLTLSSVPNSETETLIYFKTGTSCTLSIPTSTKYVGDLSLQASSDYVMSILKGVVVIGKVETK